MKTKRLLLLTIFCLNGSYMLSAQGTDFVLGSRAYDLLDHYSVRSGKQFFTTVKPYTRSKGLKLVRENSLDLNSVQQFNLRYLQIATREYLGDSTLGKTEKPVFNQFYKYENDFLWVSTDGLDLHVNPVIYLQAGADSGLSDPLFTNTRGIELRGTLDKRISFYTTLQENQNRLPQYVQSVQDTVGLIPYEGFWKAFNGDAYDFLRASGNVDFNISDHFQAQFGFGRHFVGNGMRSLILSDFSNSYPYLRLTAEVWKFKYTNIFAELVADVEFLDAAGNLGSKVYPKKYFAFHHLDFAVNKNLHIGLFESVMTGRPDSLGGTEFKVQYLNPIIFYGALEQQDGSADNVIVGLDFSWNLLKRIQLYGQFTLDELIVSELFSDNGWWGNKFAYQLGAKYYDFIVPTLNLQLEFNQARPFTYAHDGSYTNYVHYRQPLAHPLGANFSEVIMRGSCQPFKKWEIENRTLIARYGSGPVNGRSVGRNPLVNSNERGTNNDFNHRQGQGIMTDLYLTQIALHYQWKYDLFLDLNFTYRIENREDSPDVSSTIFTTGLRWNLPSRNYLF